MVDFSVLENRDVKLALGAMAFNTTLVIAAWFGRVYWMHGIEQVVNKLQGQAKRRKDNMYLSENFAPIQKETQAEDLDIVGKIPSDVEGVYARTGPNPALTPSGDYHWSGGDGMVHAWRVNGGKASYSNRFDGDGMVHACRIKGGKASYSNRLVKTHRLQREVKQGFPLYLRFGDMRGFWGIWHAGLSQLRKKTGITPTHEGEGTANTALVYHANKLMSLHEGDLPYAIKVLCNGIVDTLGRMTFGGKVNHPFTAHPKVDPVTGELFFIGYQMDKKPACVWYAGLDREGALKFDVKVPLQEGVMMHDMAITEDYAIILDVPLVFRPEVMVTKNRLPLVYDKSRPARFGIIDKRPKSGNDVRWFELDPVMIFHVANSWQEGKNKEIVKLYACCFEDFDLDIGDKETSGNTMPRLREMTFNMSTGEATSRQVADTVCDFPRVPLNLVGLKSRYTYAAVFSHEQGKFSGIAKFDLSARNGGAIAGQIEHGLDRYGGEAVFVNGSGPGEDDGYLMTYVHDEKKGQSECVIYSAKTMSSQPLARIMLPQRVPYGFHGEFVTEAELASQVSSL